MKPDRELRWAIFGLCAASLTILFITAWLIVRIYDGNWADWRLPVTFVVIFVAIIAIGAMFTAIPEIKQEIETRTSV
jgi:hypothetical protein